MDIFVTSGAVKGLLSYLFISLVVGFAVVVFIQLVGPRPNFGSRSGFGSRSSRYLALLIIIMSFLGATVGITGGWSREGVVGDVIPAILGLVGGLSVYLFENNRGKALVVLPATLAFTLTVYVGYFVGAEIRNPAERAVAYRDMCFTALSNPEILSSNDAYCRFLVSAGDRCFRELFKNKMTYQSNARYGDVEYKSAWKGENKRRAQHMYYQCYTWKKDQEKALLNYFKALP